MRLKDDRSTWGKTYARHGISVELARVEFYKMRQVSEKGSYTPTSGAA